ncbi:hypothetical protein HYH03_014865 [Edaphochlamys debaryana]|uniref:Uncharacterized protein n=1 Tax=Edaphochlamys debaryana TaxID=47281 RepID=A0A836BT33_9CHLO|nr:hypothetical protein HYH03_014865 [Edaphochlamys debaryana]|eukprot:KAG2486418.1 hypothetical protein HYH03_014865 [Edaphochlamys debaryana]
MRPAREQLSALGRALLAFRVPYPSSACASTASAAASAGPVGPSLGACGAASIGPSTSHAPGPLRGAQLTALSKARRLAHPTPLAGSSAPPSLAPGQAAALAALPPPTGPLGAPLRLCNPTSSSPSCLESTIRVSSNVAPGPGPMDAQRASSSSGGPPLPPWSVFSSRRHLHSTPLAASATAAPTPPSDAAAASTSANPAGVASSNSPLIPAAGPARQTPRSKPRRASAPPSTPSPPLPTKPARGGGGGAGGGSGLPGGGKAKGKGKGKPPAAPLGAKWGRRSPLRLQGEQLAQLDERLAQLPMPVARVAGGAGAVEAGGGRAVHVAGYYLGHPIKLDPSDPSDPDPAAALTTALTASLPGLSGLAVLASHRLHARALLLLLAPAEGQAGAAGGGAEAQAQAQTQTQAQAQAQAQGPTEGLCALLLLHYGGVAMFNVPEGPGLGALAAVAAAALPPEYLAALPAQPPVGAVAAAGRAAASAAAGGAAAAGAGAGAGQGKGAEQGSARGAPADEDSCIAAWRQAALEHFHVEDQLFLVNPPPASANRARFQWIRKSGDAFQIWLWDSVTAEAIGRVVTQSAALRYYSRMVEEYMQTYDTILPLRAHPRPPVAAGGSGGDGLVARLGLVLARLQARAQGRAPPGPPQVQATKLRSDAIATLRDMVTQSCGIRMRLSSRLGLLEAPASTWDSGKHYSVWLALDDEFEIDDRLAALTDQADLLKQSCLDHIQAYNDTFAKRSELVIIGEIGIEILLTLFNGHGAGTAALRRLGMIK